MGFKEQRQSDRNNDVKRGQEKQKGMIVIRTQISNEKKQENNLANYLHNNKSEGIKNIFQQTKDVGQNTVGSEEDISIDEGYLYIFFHS
jgi:hypothetical protein